MNLMKILLILSMSLLTCIVVNASSNSHGSEGHIPWKTIVVQIINLSICIGILIYFTKDVVRSLFKERSEKYFSFLNEAKIALDKAQGRKNKIQERLNLLENNIENDTTRIQAEANEYKNKLVNEAKDLSNKIKKDFERTVEFELEKGKQKLRNELMDRSIVMAREVLAQKVDNNMQKELQIQFVEKIQVV